jgi:hypothetical protein
MGEIFKLVRLIEYHLFCNLHANKPFQIFNFSFRHVMISVQNMLRSGAAANMKQAANKICLRFRLRFFQKQLHIQKL